MSITRYAGLQNSCELIFGDAIKNVADGTVRHEAVSVDNSDISTLRIVKERQPILTNR